jgi:sulfate transport system permease protein
MSRALSVEARDPAPGADPHAVVAARREPRLAQGILIFLASAYVGFLILIPVAAVLAAAFAGGPAAWWRAVTEPDALAALGLSLEVMAIVVPLNTLFGLSAAWALTKHRFPGQRLLSALIDLPLAVSPVVSGLLFVLLFGAHGWFAPLLSALGLKIIFATPGIVLATMFVTFPLVARELIPVLESQGTELEEAALSLGASGWQLLLRVTLPAAKWGLLYGIVLTTARSLGEFGAVSVVSGHIRGATNTLPLHVEVLYGEYNFGAASAVASVLIGLGLLSLLAKRAIERKRRTT